MSAVLQEAANDIQPERVELSVAVTPEIRQVASISGALSVAQAYDVDCAEMAQALADERRLWAQKIDRIEAMKKDLMDPLKKAVEAMRLRFAKWFDPALADLTQARDLAGEKLLAWENAERARIARENAEREALARKLRQEAEQKAAQERAKAEEAARVEREKAAAAEEQRRQAAAEAERLRREGDAKAAAEADRRAKTAAAEAARAQEKEQAAIENGNAKAQESQMQAATAVSAAPVVTATKISGQSMKDNWVAELRPGVTINQAKDMIVLARAGVEIVDGKPVFNPSKMRPDLLALIEIDTAPRGPLNKLAAALKDAFSVPGFVAVNRQTLAGARK